MVPEGWGRFSVGDVFEVQLGKMLNQIAMDGEEQRDYLTNINVRWGQFNLSSLNRMHFNAKEREKFRLKAGDLIVCEGGEVGRCAIWKDELVECYYQKALHRLRPKEGTVLPEYAYMFFEHGNANGLFLHYSTRSSIAHLTREKLVQVPILLPPLTEQRKIADILSTWDQAIEKAEALLSNARTQKRALMQQLLTGKRRFPAFEGQPWKEVRLGDLCEIRRGASPRPIKDSKWFADEGRGWVRIADVTASTTTQLTQTTQYLSAEGVSKSVPVEPGELIMSICATIGVPRIVGIPVCIHDGFVVFRGTKGRIHREFLYHYIEFVTERLKNSGQPGTQKNLNTTIVGNIQVPHITIVEQEQIAALLQDADDGISKFRTDIEKLRTEKKALMQQLLTGKRRVVV